MIKLVLPFIQAKREFIFDQEEMVKAAILKFVSTLRHQLSPLAYSCIN